MQPTSKSVIDQYGRHVGLPSENTAQKHSQRGSIRSPVETIVEIIASGLLFAWIETNLATPHEGVLAIGLVAWFGARCLIEIPKGIFKAICALGRLARRFADR